MRGNRTRAPIVLAVLLLAIPLTGIDCDETGDFLRGPESRTFATEVATQISSGVITAIMCEFSGRLFFGDVPFAGLRACAPDAVPEDTDSATDGGG